jgi:hypothetical protein
MVTIVRICRVRAGSRIRNREIQALAAVSFRERQAGGIAVKALPVELNLVILSSVGDRLLRDLAILSNSWFGMALRVFPLYSNLTSFKPHTQLPFTCFCSENGLLLIPHLGI